MVKICCVGKPTVKSKSFWNLVANNPINQLPKILVMIYERGFLLLALFFFNETVKLQLVVFIGGAYIIGNNIVVGYFVALFSVVPEIADIFYALAAVIYQNIVNRNNSMFAAACVGAFLQPFESFLVNLFLVPLSFCDPAVKARLVC